MNNNEIQENKITIENKYKGFNVNIEKKNKSNDNTNIIKEKNDKLHLIIKENKNNLVNKKIYIDETFKNSIRNRYKRKRNQLLDA